MRPALYGTALTSRASLTHERRSCLAGPTEDRGWAPSVTVRMGGISVSAMVKILVAVAIGLVVSQVALYLTTIYLHRALSHRAVTLSPVATATCRVLTWMLTGIRPRQWVAVHRKHHAHTDKIGDPHSPVLLGYARVQWTNVALYRKVARDPDEVARYARDLPPDRWDRVLFDHSLLGLGLGIGLLFVVGGWEIALIASVVHTVFYSGGQRRHQRRRASLGPASLTTTWPPTTSGWPGWWPARVCTTTTTRRPPRAGCRWPRASSTPPGGWSV
jgi:fatty acid desaturase